MESADLKANIRKLVDQIDDPQMLETLYNFLKSSQSRQEGQLWQELSESQKEAVLKAYEESEDDDNLMPPHKVFKDLQ